MKIWFLILLMLPYCFSYVLKHTSCIELSSQCHGLGFLLLFHNIPMTVSKIYIQTARVLARKPQELVLTACESELFFTQKNFVFPLQKGKRVIGHNVIVNIDIG